MTSRSELAAREALFAELSEAASADRMPALGDQSAWYAIRRARGHAKAMAFDAAQLRRTHPRHAAALDRAAETIARSALELLDD